MRLSVSEIADAVGGRIISGDGGVLIENISTDSNKVGDGYLFVPIIGAKVDGHKFMSSAFDNGAAASLTSKSLAQAQALNDENFTGKPLILIEDTVKALQALGTYYRENYVSIPYIGVTGSAGKTTTREMAVLALSGTYNTYGTKGNANSQVGVPITAYLTPDDVEIAVIEMGISEPGEMSRLSKIVKCDIAIVTLIGQSHISNLGSMENIMIEKLRIVECMKDGGKLLLNGDDELLSMVTKGRLRELGIEVKDSIDIIFYGTGDNSFFRAENISYNQGISYDFYIGNEKTASISLKVSGRHMLMDSLAALSAAALSAADIKSAARALSGFKNLNGRGEIKEVNGIKLINDAYNASPQSMEAGLRTFSDMVLDSGRRIAVIADMLELGDIEISCHESLGKKIAETFTGIDTVLLYGNLTEHTFNAILSAADNDKDIKLTKHGNGIKLEFPSGRTLTAEHFSDKAKLKENLISMLQKNDAVFLKGSNSMGLWQIAEEIIGEAN